MEPIDLVGRLGRWATGRGPLYALLAGRLRQLIDDGDLGPGVLLPPDRTLAAALSVGRSTVVAAYNQLITEGRIVRRQGSGTRVAGTPAATPPETTGAPVFLHLLEPQDGTIMLACAAPAVPPPELADAYAAVLPRLASYGIGYHPAGVLELRQALADRYTRQGRPTHPDQILVTNGGQQALSLLARSFVAPGDPVLLEAPTYPGALEVFRDQAATLHPLPVGLDGFEAAVRRRRPALAYVVPVFQNPTGGVLGSLQRQRLAAVAQRYGVPLVEDEILADLAFPGTDQPRPDPTA
ncbi:PLP-dependent aminotransferase family protein [Kribbella flavida]|uniref:aminotransferase-like domain-containing protein n=1 Tax=Kribbella flavida TaxID=182640 RepID=UPI00019BE30B|nr:PLP-dependent aminotransferase family protein [Kribbella flavida]